MEQKECVIPIHRPDYNEMLFFFTCGVIMSVAITLFVAGLGESFLVGLDISTAALVSTAFFAPLIEEFSKIFPLYYRHGETQRSIMQLALAVGFGFGLVEMLTYITILGVDIPSRLPGLLFHPASTSIAAYGIATKRPLPYYLLAVLLHFANNFLALTNPFPISASVFIVAATFWVAWRLYHKTKEKFIN